MTRARDLADSADKDIAGTLTLDAVNASGVVTGLTVEATGDTAAGDNAAMGYTAAEGLVLTGQGSTNDVTIKNDADADVIEIPTGTVNVTMAGTLGVVGEIAAASLDISGNIDVDGTTNLDVVDIDGAVDMASTLALGGDLTTAADANIIIQGTHNEGGALLDLKGTDTPAASKNLGSISFGNSTDRSLAMIRGISTAADAADLTFSTEATGAAIEESMRIQSNGSVGINVNNPSSFNSGAHNLVVGSTSISSQGITVASSTNSIIYFADGTSGAEAFAGSIIYNHADSGGNNMTFRTNGFNSALVISSNQSVSTPTAGTSNVRLGVNAGDAIASGGQYNVLIGDEAGTAVSTGDKNTAVGFTALNAEQLGSQSTAVGYQALFSQNMGSSVNSDNTAVGYNAGSSTVGGARNTFIGSSAGLSANVDDAVCIGFNAGGGASMTGHDNVLIGKDSGQSMTAGQANVMVGRDSGQATNTGQWNIAIGDQALQANQEGDGAVAIGRDALAVSQPADGVSYNVAIGYQAGKGVSTGTANVFIGADTGNATCTGSVNTSVGYGALQVLTSGSHNTAVGDRAGFAVNSGSNLLLLGNDAGRSNAPGGEHNTGSNSIVLGDNSILNAYIKVDWTVTSDERDKTDFTALDLGLDFVKAMKPYTFKWDQRSDYGDFTADDYKVTDQTPDGTHKKDQLDVGFKAQDIEQLEKAAGYKIDDKTNLIASLSEDETQYGLKYSKFIPILVKAIQEQNALIESLTARVATLEG